ncbi:MAG: hypothetical protein ACR2L8_14825 [Solirubrobacteraceae bacterium]
MLTRLWRLRLAVAAGVLAAALLAVAATQDVSLSPPSVKASRSAFGAAKAQVFVDSERPSLVTGEADAATLAARAQIVSRFVDSGAIRTALGRSLDVPARDITVTGPAPDTPGSQNSQPVAQQRANALLGEGSPLSVYVDTEASAPVVTFFVQARTGAEAIRLARATTSALRVYVARLRREAEPGERVRLDRQLEVLGDREGRPIGRAERRQREAELFEGSTVVRPLGPPVGGDVTEETGRVMTLGVFVVLAVGWCIALLLVGGLRDAARRRR